MREKIVRSVLVGLLGSVLFPLSFYVLMLLGMLYEHKGLIGIAPDVSDGWGGLSYLFWTLILLPILACFIGALSLKINSNKGSVKFDFLILPLISGIIASVLGFIFYIFFSGIILPYANWDVVFHSRISILTIYLSYDLPFLLLWSVCSLGGVPIYTKLPSLSPSFGSLKKMPGKAILLISCALILALLIGVCLFTSQGSIYIKDAYCDDNGHFNFTIINGKSAVGTLAYKWHLDDPKAQQLRARQDETGHFTGDYYIGNGTVTIPGNSDRTIMIPLAADPDYPQNNLVMDVELFEGNTSVCHYREQKSPYQWDYRTLPPKPL